MENDEQIRRMRLKFLIDRNFHGNQSELVALLPGASAQSEISSLLRNKSFGEKKARSLEDQIGLPKKWLDQPIAADEEENVGPVPTEVGQRVPQIDLVAAGDLCETADPYPPGKAQRLQNCPVKIGKRGYALVIKGDSMDDGTRDAYREGDIIFVDPDRMATPGNDVIARTLDGKTTFKRLKEDEEGLYLLALNPGWDNRIIRVPKGTVICGVVVATTPRSRKTV